MTKRTECTLIENWLISLNERQNQIRLKLHTYTYTLTHTAFCKRDNGLDILKQIFCCLLNEDLHSLRMQEKLLIKSNIHS